jgi:hypothetical protein
MNKSVTLFVVFWKQMEGEDIKIRSVYHLESEFSAITFE